jgi:hypothetical protein
MTSHWVTALAFWGAFSCAACASDEADSSGATTANGEAGGRSTGGSVSTSSGGSTGGSVSIGSGGSTGGGSTGGGMLADGSGSNDGRTSTDGAVLTGDARSGGPRELRVNGQQVIDSNGDVVTFRGIEQVKRWSGGDDLDPNGAMWLEIAKTRANTIRILNATPSELEGLLQIAARQHVWVSIAGIDFFDPATKAAVEKHKNYVTLHAQGEVAYDNSNQWRIDSINKVKQFRTAGYTVPLEMLADGYGQNLSTILSEGEAVFNSDPLGNIIFGYQMYSGGYVDNIPGTLDQVKAFPHPIWVGTSLFQLGIDNGWETVKSTYQKVWDGTGTRGISSLYWMWHGDNNERSSDGTVNKLTAEGHYIVFDSPYALSTHAVKSAFLLASAP